MNELFGMPMETLLVVLAVMIAAAGGILGLLALRHRVLLKLGVRNVGRRRARSALIVVGLMLGTTIIAAALVTGDTMNHTIRSTAVSAFGETDEVVSAKGAVEDIAGELGQASGTRYFPQRTVEQVAGVLGRSDLADGVAGGIRKDVAVQAPRQRQTEPSVSLFAPDPSRMEGFAPIRNVEGGEVALADLRPGELYLNEEAADRLHVGSQDPLLIYIGAKPVRMTISAIVRFEGAGTADSALLLPLGEAQRLYGKPGLIEGILISNRGTGDAAVGLTDEVVDALRPTVQPLGLETAPAKKDALELADQAGNAFMTLFTTFGTFSIAAGILLIFLIFVMLAAERRGELGIARAVGTRRGHLVQMFTFEGAAYDLIAAAAGALLGAVVAYGMVLAMGTALEGQDAGLQVEYFASWQSLFVAFAIGGLLTLFVVAFSAWRVSVMTISTAIRNLPEPPSPRRRRRLVLAFVTLALGALLILSGASGDAATPLMLGISLVLVGLVPLLRLVGVPERAAYTACGLAIAVAMLLPWDALGVRLRPDLDGLLDLDRLGADDRDRRGVGDGLQRRPHPPRCELRPLAIREARTRHTDGDHVSASSAVPDGGDVGDVHTRRVHARHRNGGPELLRPSVGQHGRVRRWIRGTRRHVCGGAGRGSPGCTFQRAGHQPKRVHGSRQPVGPLGQGQADRRRSSGGELRRARARPGLPRAHDLRPRCDGDGIRICRPGLERDRGPARTCRRRRPGRAAPGQLEHGSSSGLPALRLRRGGRRLRPSSDRSPRSTDRDERPA